MNQMMQQQQMIQQQQMMKEQMMQLMMQQQMITESHPIPEENNNIITVKFTKKNNPDIYVQAFKDEKVKDLITRQRISVYDLSDKIKFIFNSYELCPELTVDESHLTNNSKISIVNIKDAKGAP